MEPRLTSMLLRVLGDKALLAELTATFGSPLHVVFPQQALSNAENWVEGLAETYPDIDVRFGMKACKSELLTQAFARGGVGADASSAEEAVAAMRNFVRADRISLTGPQKPDFEIALAISHGLNLHIDSVQEFERFHALSTYLGRRSPISFRLKPASAGQSRFGFGFHDFSTMLRHAATLGYAEGGLSFHINDYDVSSRTSALREAHQLAVESEQYFRVNSIDLGGGYPINYTEKFDSMDFLAGPHWKNQSGQLYPYDTVLTSAKHASAIIEALETQTRGDLLARRIKLMFQPGRSLLDQCGITIFRVIGSKSSPDFHEHSICTLDGTSFSLSETWFNADFAPAPIILSGGQWQHSVDGNFGYFLMGRSCLESDVIRSRAIRSHHELKRGDLICFTNTAGYQMDSNESPFHRLPLPKKVALFEHEGTLRAVEDTNNYFMEFHR